MRTMGHDLLNRWDKSLALAFGATSTPQAFNLGGKRRLTVEGKNQRYARPGTGDAQ
jgi:hypothetical protein